MQIKAQALKIKGMNKDLSYSSFNSEFSWHNKNIRLTARDGNNLTSITNEKGNIKLSYNEIVPEQPYIVIQTNQATQVSTNYMYFNGYLDTLHPSLISEMGFLYSTNSNVSIDNSTKVIATRSNGNFSEYPSENLVFNTKYYYRAYCIFNKVLYYGDILYSTTLNVNIPSVSTLGATSITSSSLVSGGYSINDGGSDILEKGVVYSSTNNTPTYTANDGKINNGGNSENYQSILSDLASGTQYYVRAYVVNTAGVGYGEVITATTYEVLPPSIATADVVVNGLDATTGGTAIELNGSTFISKGVVLGDFDTVTIEDNLAFQESAELNANAFSVTFIGLNPTIAYYARAYVISSSGTAYGDASLSFSVGEAP